MSDVTLNLIVLRSADLDRAAQFYALLGLTFAREQHGAGPEHLACELGPVVLEIYPLGKGAPTTGVRLGFRVRSMQATLAALQAAGGKVLTPPANSPWGLRAVVADPDGHRIELSESNQPTDGMPAHQELTSGSMVATPHSTPQSTN